MPLFEEGGGEGGPPRGSRLPVARDAAEAPPASHSVQEVPADERSAATPLRVRVVGGEGGGWFWGIGGGGGGKGRFLKAAKKSTFYYANREKRMLTAEKQKRV